MKLVMLQLLILLLANAANACANGRAGNFIKRNTHASASLNLNFNVSAHFVQETIDNNKVVIFSKTTCLYSTLAKEQFQKLNFPFLAVELDHRHDGNLIQSILGEMTDASTVPRVFVDGLFIGGGTEVKAFYESGKLKKLLNV